MSEFRILDTNYVFDDATDILPTSENSLYPASNLRSHIRAKAWRSSGYFVIDATNNKLDFDEGGGELVATITSGNYTASTLATEIKTQLDTAGGDTYTVSYSTSDGRWTIASDGSTLELLWDTGTDTAVSIGSTIGFDTSTDDTGLLSYESDFTAIHTEEAVVFDLLAATDIDSFVMLFDPFEGVKLSGSASVHLQANATNSWSSPAVDITLSLDTIYDSYTHYFATAQNYRYWRVQIIDPTNANLYVEIPFVSLAMGTQLSQMPQIGFQQGQTDLSQFASNEFGHRFYDVYPNQRSFAFEYVALTSSDTETLWRIFQLRGNSEPFVVVIDPLAALFDKDRFTFYGYISGDLVTVNSFYNFFDTSFSMVEAL